MKKKNNAYIAMLPYIIIGVCIIASLFVLNNDKAKINTLTTGELITSIKKEEVTSIEITPKSADGVYYVTGTIKGYKDKDQHR